jgi:hypothetical protein
MKRVVLLGNPQNRHRLKRHLLFWLVANLILPLIYGNSIAMQKPTDAIIIAWLLMPYNMMLVYTALYWVLAPVTVGQNDQFFSRLGLYFGMGWLLMFFYSAYVLIPFQTQKMPVLLTYKAIFPTYGWSTLNLWFIGLIVSGAAVRIKLYLFWQRREELNQQLLRETLAVELQVLKAKIHPHFLFNTLNNLYSLTLKQSLSAPDMVLKLSDLLYYMIHECNAPTVPLTKEIAFLQNYIELEKLRYGPRLLISSAIAGDMEAKIISPLLLIPFIENAFKHGSAKQIGQTYIKLSLTVTANMLTFRLENNIDTYATDNCHRAGMGGLGLPNARKRLALLYPNRHQLIVRPEPERFVIDLMIDLTVSQRVDSRWRSFVNTTKY